MSKESVFGDIMEWSGDRNSLFDGCRLMWIYSVGTGNFSAVILTVPTTPYGRFYTAGTVLAGWWCTLWRVVSTNE